ncbi:uncharacterized protein PRCAT00002231001 [Priceomyces carsonii]|uniref:uncharacterized protein n=1 Tax=Priceomyces carsonii TaxID=28549 RepID=UPI002ED8ACFF|nr:unnamed protein product [Priceomyces carsonii]
MAVRSRNRGRALLPFGLEYKDILTSSTGDEQPQIELPLNGPLSEREAYAAQKLITFLKEISEGPFHVWTGRDLEDSVTASDHVQRYSDRYNKVKKSGGKMEDRKFELEYFPDELHSVMGTTKKRRKDTKREKDTTKLSSNDKVTMLDGSVTINGKDTLEKLSDIAGELDADVDHSKEDEDDGDEEEVDEEQDDEFDEDDDDDYNAEKYFDDGDDDVGDDGDDEAAF